MSVLNNQFLKLYDWPNHRKVGRYNSSEIYNIIKGELTVENYFDNSPMNMGKLKNIWRGIGLEAKMREDLEKIGYKLKWNEEGGQMKYELKVEDFVIVVCPDFHVLNGLEMGHSVNEFILETKCPNKVKTEIPPWYLYQLECQSQATHLPIYLTQINTSGDNDWGLICALEYTPSPIRFKNIKEKISEFNKQLKNKYKE